MLVPIVCSCCRLFFHFLRLIMSGRSGPYILGVLCGLAFTIPATIISLSRARTTILRLDILLEQEVSVQDADIDLSIGVQMPRSPFARLTSDGIAGSVLFEVRAARAKERLLSAGSAPPLDSNVTLTCSCYDHNDGTACLHPWAPDWKFGVKWPSHCDFVSHMTRKLMWVNGTEVQGRCGSMNSTSSADGCGKGKGKSNRYGPPRSARESLSWLLNHTRSDWYVWASADVLIFPENLRKHLSGATTPARSIAMGTLSQWPYIADGLQDTSWAGLKRSDDDRKSVMGAVINGVVIASRLAVQDAIGLHKTSDSCLDSTLVTSADAVGCLVNILYAKAFSPVMEDGTPLCRIVSTGLSWTKKWDTFFAEGPKFPFSVGGLTPMGVNRLYTHMYKLKPYGILNLSNRTEEKPTSEKAGQQ